MKVPGENSKTFQSIVAGNDTEQSELAKWVPLDAADQAVLTSQLSEALQAAERYPTVASAKAAGMILAGGMAPGVGRALPGDQRRRSSRASIRTARVNPCYPASWIYASTADNAPVVGVMYESLTDTAAGRLHRAQRPLAPSLQRLRPVQQRERSACRSPPTRTSRRRSAQTCTAIFMKKTVWMVHAWVVPGWESPQGVFSHDNLHVYCPGNTDLTDAIGFCDRQSVIPVD